MCPVFVSIEYPYKNRMLLDTFTLDIFGFGTDTNIPDISDLFLYDLEEEKTEKRKEQKRKSDRKAYRKKVRANGFAPVKYRKGGQKLTRA